MLTVFFLLLYFREKMKNRQLHSDLKYMNDKLGKLTGAGNPKAEERLLLMTRDPELQLLLQGINDLLDSLQQSTSNYEKSERAMRRMLSNVSHDLKTPLTVIMGYAEILLRNMDLSEQERRRMTEQISNKAAEVNERILAFFDLSRLEADDVDLPPSVVDAGEVCRSRILSYFDLLAERNMAVDIHLPEEPVWVYVNEEALSRVLDNLLSNAVRYGGDGGYLGLSLTTTQGYLRIDVTDRGKGIARKDQGRVFERMYTMEDSRDRNVQGSGLGLAIAKKLTERMGGEISLTSNPGVSTCFSIQLPLSTYKENGLLKK